MDVITLFTQLGFPVAVAVFLLWDRTQNTAKMINTMAEFKLALYLVLEKLDAIPEYEKRVKEHRLSKEA